MPVRRWVYGSITLPKNKWHRLPDGHDCRVCFIEENAVPVRSLLNIVARGTNETTMLYCGAEEKLGISVDDVVGILFSTLT